jgi:hypothetical protein
MKRRGSSLKFGTSTSPSILSDKQFITSINLREPFEKFVDWRKCAAVMQREAETVMPSCSGGGNTVVA